MEPAEKSLRDLWKEQGYNTEDLAIAVKKLGAKCVSPTLYKMAHRKDSKVEFGTIKAVCQILGLTLEEYDKLPPCVNANEYTITGRKRHEHL